MKEEILQKSLQLFLKHGVREMSNQNLVELLGISTKTLYKYFKNKEDLLDAALDLFYDQHRDTWKKIISNRSSVVIFFDIWYVAIDIEYNINKKFFHDLHHYYRDLELKKEKALAEEYVPKYMDVIYKGIEEGVFQKQTNPDIFFGGISILFRSIVRDNYFKDSKVSAFDVFLNTLGNYIRGFCTEKGLKELNKHIKAVEAASKIDLPQDILTTEFPSLS